MKIRLTLFFTLITNISLAQDTAKYCQQNLTPYGYNCFHFYKTKKTGKVGTFEQFQWFDDGQKSYGKGEFTESTKAITLKPYLLIKTHDVYIRSVIKNGIVEDSVAKDVKDTTRIKTDRILYKEQRMLYSVYIDKKNDNKSKKVYYESEVKKTPAIRK